MDNIEEENKNVVKVDINKEMKEAYMQYSMSVIVGRALPDVRDGLKPVHRRILFAMHDLGNYHNKPYKKSARVVGDVIGKYHPHGDTAVYDSLVRMAQDFSLRAPLVDGQGNFGSIDGDSPAAQRYTEVRMTHLAESLLEDIEKNTVPFGPNYDDSLEIPLVLPAKFPNLLVNGGSGIAVGMATNIPPHNMGEVIEGCIRLIDNPSTTIDELIKIIPGPDFPSAGLITGRNGIIKAYKTGRGIVPLRAVAEIDVLKNDRERILVTELPYQVNKAKLIESIADLVKDGKIEGISDIRDESSREGMRIVIDIKKNANGAVILNQLYKFTQLQTSFGILMLALDSRNQPRIFNIKDMLEAFITHRRDVVTKRCLFELGKAEARIHILEGLRAALDKIDAVVSTIRASADNQAAKAALISNFSFSEVQAQAILDMRLVRLTGLEREKIESEIKELEEKIAWLKKVLNDSKELDNIIVGELTEIRDKFGNPRRSKITDEVEDIDDDDLVTKEDIVVTMTHSGYIKRIPVETYRVQNRGGKGLKGIETRSEDSVTNIFMANTLTMLLVFTDKGRVYWLKVYRLPAGSRTSRGKSIANVIQFSSNEKVQAILPVDEFDDNNNVVLVTKKGVIKKTPLSAFKNPRPSGIIALKIDLDDSLSAARLSTGKDDIFVATSEGMSIRFDESNVRPMGRTARGVRAITLSKSDEVVASEVLEKNESGSILIVTQNGYGKKTSAEEYRTQGRGGSGIITQKTTDKIGKVVAAYRVEDGDNVIIITDKGKVIRLECAKISKLGRNTQGVRLINLNEGEVVSSVAHIAGKDEIQKED